MLHLSEKTFEVFSADRQRCPPSPSSSLRILISYFKYGQDTSCNEQKKVEEFSSYLFEVNLKKTLTISRQEFELWPPNLVSL